MASGSSAGNGKTLSIGTKTNDVLTGTDDQDKILGGNGNDVLAGNAGADRIYGGAGDDTILGGGGSDELKGDSGNDILDGGAGSDRVEGGSGDDVAVYVMAENTGGRDEYDGGAGADTLRLVLTREEWLRADVQSDVARYLAFIAANTNDSGQSNGHAFEFTAFGLEATKFEKLEVMVDGQLLDPRDELADAIDDAATGTEDQASVTGNVLANDLVPDLVRSVELVIGPAHGDLTFNPDGSYSYAPGAYFNALAQGETATETFVYRVTDADGDTDTGTVTITITGTNDVPVITSAVQAGSVTEDGVSVATGQLTAVDVDHGATQTWSIQGPASSAYGSIAVNASGQWTYTLANGSSAVQGLAAGESHDESYTVRVTDDQGAFADHAVTVTVTGTNDVPVVAAFDVTGGVSESGAPSGNLVDTGTLTFTDLDLTDAHSISAVTPSAGALGTLTAAVTTDTTGSGTGGVVTWNFSVAASAVEYLAAGQTKVESFTFNVLDGHGGSVPRTVSVTLTGTNDVPAITAADTTGAVTAVPVEPEAAPAPLMFTVQQFLGYQSNDLNALRNYATTHAADYTVQTDVIDYTDDPGGFAGELPGSSRWPAAEAQNVSGTGGVNNVFFARITADFSVSTADTYTFRTYNDDGVFLLIDNTLVISDTGYHPEAPFQGNIALAPGNHTIELFFFENGGEASLEFSARNSTGTFGLVGANGGGLGGAISQVTDSGVITFSDVDLTDVHLVSATPVGGTLGTLTATKNTDSTGTGTGGQLTWSYAVANSAIAYLADGQTKVESFTITLNDQHGGVVTRQVDVTITGTNDAPAITAVVDAGAVTEDVTLAATGQLTATDVDDGAALTWSVPNGAGTYGTLGVDQSGQWTYTLNNAAGNVQALAQDETVTDSFTVQVADEQGATATHVVNVSVAGTNDGPVITGGTTNGAVTEDGASVATGQLTAVDPDHGAPEFWTVQGGTPSGNADYHFRMDSLTVTRNGTTFFQDNFSDGVAPPTGPNGTLTYTGIGAVDLTESDGRLNLYSESGVSFVGVGASDPILGVNAILRSNIDPANLTQGLKSNHNFTVTGVFDLIIPDSPRENYGIRLTDRLVGGPGTPPDQLGDNVVDFRVQERTDGTVVVRLREVNFVTDTTTLLESVVLAPPASADQIRLNLTHSTAHVGEVTASFEYLAGGVVVGSQTLGAVGHIFQGENWVRAEVIASAPAVNDSQLGGTYGTLNVDQTGTWTYTLDNSRAATQALGEGEHATETFTVQVADEYGEIDTQIVSIDVTGKNDAPFMHTPAVSRALTEDLNVTAGNLAATGDGQFSDVDITDTHTLTAALSSATLSSGATLTPALAAALNNAVAVTLLDPATGDGHAQYAWNFALANSATQFLGAGQTLSLVYNIAATDQEGAAATQQLTISINGTNDAPVISSGATQTFAFEYPDNNNYSTYPPSYTEGGFVFQGFYDYPYTYGVNGSGMTYTHSSYNWVAGGSDGVVRRADGADFSLESFSAATYYWEAYYGGMSDYLVTVTGYNDGAPVASRSLTYGLNHQNFTFDSSWDSVDEVRFSLPSYQNVNGTYYNSQYLFLDNLVVGQGSTATSVSITEIADGASGENTATHTRGGTIAFTDADGSDTHGASVVPQGAGYLGTFTLGTVNQTGDSVSWDFAVPDGQLDSLKAGQTVVQSYVVSVNDGHGGVANQSVSVTLVGSNDAPVAANDSASTNEDTATTINVLANDTDVDTGDTKSLVSVQGASHGTVSIAGGNVTFTPDANYNGADSFTYTMKDAAGATSSATVNVTVNPVSDTYTLSNLIVNGSFEQATSGWTQIAGGVDVVHQSGWQSGDGAYSLDLNAFNPGGVQQVLQTTPGVQYTVGFELSKNPGNGDHATVQVSAAGSAQSYTFSAANSATNMMWSEQTFTFVATGTTTTLAFASTYPTGFGFPFNAQGPALDEVVVVSNKAISSFTKGAGGDVLQLHDVLTSVSAPHDGTAFSNGYLRFLQSGSDTLVQVDANGGGNSYLTLATLTSTLLTQADTANYTL